MDIRNFNNNDTSAVFNLYNTYAPGQGYTKLNQKQFNSLVIRNAFFNARFAFVIENEGKISGFVCGASHESLPQGTQRGYFSCLVLADDIDFNIGFNMLMSALENSFKAAGCSFSDVLFFNPIRLPWDIPGTDGHTHNNAPGIWVDGVLHKPMLNRGYVQRACECAMYLKLDNFTLPEKLVQKQLDLTQQGYEICFYNPKKHTGLEDMLNTLQNPEWINEISGCAVNGTRFLIAAHNGQAVGFAGPVYPEEGGRGYFTGIGVVPAHEGKGLGTLLFYRLCEAEEAANAKYMSLFTGRLNPARKIYAGAGFQAVRLFGIMRKELK